MFRCQRQPEIILTDVNQIGQPFQKAQDNQHIGQCPDRNPAIAPFEACDRTRRGSGAHGEVGYGDTTPQTRISDVLPQPFEGRFCFRRAHLNSPYPTL
ncbi:UNVERIFIED_ORG: hypothetical protein J2W19_001065 [Shinella zoogloeoides]|nr:hypothetical protein [Shinella zoogloeoides]